MTAASALKSKEAMDAVIIFGDRKDSSLELGLSAFFDRNPK